MNYTFSFIFLTLMFLLINPLWAKKVDVLKAAQEAFFLRKMSVEIFYYSRWQSVLAVFILGLIFGVGIVSQAKYDVYLSMIFSVMAVWVFIAIKVIILNILNRRKKCLVRGVFLNMAASPCLVCGVLFSGMMMVAKNLGIIYLALFLVVGYYLIIVQNIISMVFTRKVAYDFDKAL